MNEVEAREMLDGLSAFMKTTNEMLEKLTLRIENIEVDTGKINKKINRYKDNGERIVV